MSKFNEFMEALKKAPNAEELMGGKGKPESDEEMIAAYIAAAKALGFDLAEQDVVEGIRAAEQERLAMTEQAQAEMADLPDEELEEVSGGYIHQAEDGLYDVFDARGNVLARCGTHKEALQTCRSLGESTHRMTDETFNSTYAEPVRKSKEELGFL